MCECVCVQPLAHHKPVHSASLEASRRVSTQKNVALKKKKEEQQHLGLLHPSEVHLSITKRVISCCKYFYGEDFHPFFCGFSVKRVSSRNAEHAGYKFALQETERVI